MGIVKQFLCQSYALNAWVRFLNVACGCSRVGGDLESQDHHFVSEARRGLNVEHAHGLQIRGSRPEVPILSEGNLKASECVKAMRSPGRHASIFEGNTAVGAQATITL